MARRTKTRTRRVKKIRRKTTMKKFMRKCSARCGRKSRSYKKKHGGNPLIIL